jgi:hypothetical protein
MPRKTVAIAQVLFDLNQKNSLSTCSPEVRQGANSMLEKILMGADLYSGFGYLRSADIPPGQEPGIRFTNAAGLELTREQYYARRDSDYARLTSDHELPTRFTGDLKHFPDESRRTYYVHWAISADYRRIEAQVSEPGADK